MKTKDLVLMALFLATTIAQEYALSFLPNINLTHFCLALCFFTLGFYKSEIVVICYVLLDNLLTATFSLVYTLPMLTMWVIYIIMLFIFSRLFKSRRLMPAIIGAIHAFLYSWAFALVFVIFYDMDFKAYMLQDIYYELALAASAFISIFILLPRLVNIIKKITAK